MEYTDIVNDDFEFSQEAETFALCVGGGMIVAGLALALSVIIPFIQTLL